MSSSRTSFHLSKNASIAGGVGSPQLLRRTVASRKVTLKHFQGYKGTLRIPLPALSEGTLSSSSSIDIGSSAEAPSSPTKRQITTSPTKKSKQKTTTVVVDSKWKAPKCASGNVSRPRRQESLCRSSCTKLAEQLALSEIFHKEEEDDEDNHDQQGNHSALRNGS